MIGEILSHYKILEKIGEGGMGAVYKAEDLRLRRTVAIKILRPEKISAPAARERFFREARAAASLNHPHICTIHEIDESGGIAFIVMEYVDGINLKEKIQQGPLMLSETMDFALQMADGLQASHRLGILHRDIKSANIMISRSGQVKIMDFGLAKTADDLELTQDGASMGTLHYMSPEQAKGQPLDPRTDIYSFGIVLYEMVTGQLPFQGDYYQAVLYSLLNEDPSPPSSLRPEAPAALDQCVLKMLEKNRDHRFRDVEEVQSALADLSHGFLPVIKRHWRRWHKKWLLPLCFLLAFTAVFLLVRHGGRFFSTAQSGLLANRIAVMPCENRLDPGETAQIISSISFLIEEGLRPRKELSVPSRQRLLDIMRKMDRGSKESIPLADQLMVARQAQARWMVNPVLYVIGQSQELLIEVIDVANGELKTSLRKPWEPEKALDITTSVTSMLELFLRDNGAISSTDTPAVQNYFTGSFAAVQAFQQGENYSGRYYVLEAIKAYKKAVALDSTFATAYSRLAWCYFFLGQGAEGRQALDKAFENIDHINENERFYIRVERAQLLGDLETAKSTLFTWIDRFPDEKLPWFKLGYLYYWYYHQLPEAVHYLLKSLDLDPDYREAINQLAYVYAQQCDRQKAMEYANRYVAIAGDDANAYDTLGELSMNLLGDYDLAEQAFRKAVEIKHDFTPHKLAVLLQMKGRYHEAENILRSQLRQKDMVREGFKYFLIARLLYEKEDYQQAADYIRRARKASPDHARSICYSGLINLQLGRWSQAESDLRAFKGDSTATGYLYLAGSIDFYHHNTESACRRLNRLIARQYCISTSYVEHVEPYRLTLAGFYLRAGDPQKALAQCDTVIAANPAWAGAYFSKGQIYDRLADSARALAAYEAFLRAWPEADRDLHQVQTAIQRIKALKGL